MGYAFLMSMVFCVTYGFVEAFSFGNFWMTLLSMLINTVVTWVLIMLFQLLVPSKK
jgi:succinate-acetate transporter protein